jgi:hypothetical protein
MKKQIVTSAISNIDFKFPLRSLQNDRQSNAKLSCSIHADLDDTQSASAIIEHLKNENEQIAELLERFVPKLDNH